jgi:hypothetical protein
VIGYPKFIPNSDLGYWDKITTYPKSHDTDSAVYRNFYLSPQFFGDDSVSVVGADEAQAACFSMGGDPVANGRLGQ